MSSNAGLRKTVVSAVLAVLAMAAACTPIVDKHGYIPDPERMASIKVGVDNKESVYQRLGSPSTVATFGGEVWYYISSVEERKAFLAPKITKRDIIAIHFDEDDYVADISGYDVTDGKVVAYVDRKTPTRGKELTFLEQMFGNIGRLPAPSQDQPGQ